jgi:hypothetical protein
MNKSGGFAVRFTLAAAAVSLPAAVFFGCKREQPADQPVQPTPTAQPGYGQPGYGQPAPTYGQPASTGWQPTPTATAPATTPTAQPAPYAPPCQQPEGTCGWARCNLSVGRCMWPCGSDADCVAGARCMGPPGFSQCIGPLGPPAR